MSHNQRFHIDVMKLVELSKNDPSLITVEATVITGFENLAMEECQEKCKPLNISRAKGRIYFNIPVDNFCNVLKLRAVDNVFLVNEALGKIDLLKDKDKDLGMVMSIVDKVDWNNTLTTWAKLTEFEGILFPPTNPIEDFSTLVLDKENDNFPRQNDSNIINTDASISPVKEGANCVPFNGDTCKGHNNKPQHILNDPISVDIPPCDGLMELSQVTNKGLPKRKNSSSSDDSFFSVEEVDCSTDNVNIEKNNVTQDKLLTSSNIAAAQSVNKDNCQKVNPIKKNVDPNILKFRATCYRTGEHSFSSMEAAAVFGGALHDKFNWTVNLDHFNLNVILNINSDKCYICSAITPKSLHRRNITHFGYTTLRSTMCYNMIRLAQPARGEILIDPLCGGGSIPIEGALGFNSTFHVCGDNNDKAINRTVANINHISKNQQPLLVDPLKWSAKHLPLRDQCVDVFVTDLPFGKRSGKRSDNLNLYKNVLTEMARVIRCGTGRAVLLTNDKTSLTRALGGNNSTYWRQINSFGVNQGGLFSTVFLLLRTSKPLLL